MVVRLLGYFRQVPEGATSIQLPNPVTLRLLLPQLEPVELQRST